MTSVDRRTRLNSLVPGRKLSWDAGRERGWHPDIDDDEFWQLAEEFWDYTDLHTAALYNLYSTCKYVFARGLPGDIAECGVLLGGAVMFVAEMCRRASERRTIFALDTFRGFLGRESIDVDWHGNPVGHPRPNALSYREESEANMRSVGLPSDQLVVLEGDVADTAPQLAGVDLAILRLDTDLYQPTLAELTHLYPRLVSGGILIADDFGWGRGERQAILEYFARGPLMFFRTSKCCYAAMKP